MLRFLSMRRQRIFLAGCGEHSSMKTGDDPAVMTVSINVAGAPLFVSLAAKGIIPPVQNFYSSSFKKSEKYSTKY